MKLAKNVLLAIATVSLVFAPFFNSSASAVETPIFKNQASMTETTKVNKNLFQPQSETRIHLKVGDVRNFANAGNRITFSPLTSPNAIAWTRLGTYNTIQVFAVAKGQAWIEFSDDSSSWRTRYYFVVE
ncbi:hypothetical protein ACKOKD_18600 [Bacillus mojavensis]|uniref:hypothetical protein n=1 Tax=Bacillus mojavensis TaxID=72360 RepID=UPI0039678BAF